MNRFIIVDGLPYLYAGGKAYAVRWDNDGFTVGAEVKTTSAPRRVYSELSVMAQCAGNLDSIGATAKTEPDAEPDATAKTEPDVKTAPKKTARTKKKAAGDS